MCWFQRSNRSDEKEYGGSMKKNWSQYTLLRVVVNYSDMVHDYTKSISASPLAISFTRKAWNKLYDELNLED